MPKSKRRKIKAKKPGQMYLVYYEQTDEDSEEIGRLGKIEQDARIAANDWPDNDDRSELGMMKIGRAFRQLSQKIENEFYKPVYEWLRIHPQYSTGQIISHEDGYQISIEFKTQVGQVAFLAAFPKWTTERVTSWMDGVPTGRNQYDLPDDYDGSDGTHSILSKS